MKSARLSVSHAAPPYTPGKPLDKDLRGYLESNADIVTRLTKPVSLEYIPALSAASERQARALGVTRDDYLRTLAYRLRRPPRGFVKVNDGPVKEIRLTGEKVDWTKLPIPIHSEQETEPYVTAMNIVVDPETGFHNTSHAGTVLTGPRSGLPSFVTPHTHVIMRKYRELGHTRMPFVIVFGLHPAYEIMANFSGLHMDMWGELEMVGTIMDRDVEMVPCETLDMRV